MTDWCWRGNFLQPIASHVLFEKGTSGMGSFSAWALQSCHTVTPLNIRKSGHTITFCVVAIYNAPFGMTQFHKPAHNAKRV